MHNPSKFNPAAVIGVSLSRVVIDGTAGKGCYIRAYQDNKRSGRMSGSAYVGDPATAQRIQALPELADNSFAGVRGWSPKNTLPLRSWEYPALIAFVGELYRFGVRPVDPLLCEQAQVACAGQVPVDYQMAYDCFREEADALLEKVQAMGFPELAKTKGRRCVTSPRRAQALIAGAKGIFVSPDPYDARYVAVSVCGLGEGTCYALRDMAYDHYEGLGLRVQFGHI